MFQQYFLEEKSSVTKISFSAIFLPPKRGSFGVFLLLDLSVNNIKRINKPYLLEREKEAVFLTAIVMHIS